MNDDELIALNFKLVNLGTEKIIADQEIERLKGNLAKAETNARNNQLSLLNDNLRLKEANEHWHVRVEGLKEALYVCHRAIGAPIDHPLSQDALHRCQANLPNTEEKE